MKLISYLKDEHEQLAVLHDGLVYDMDTLHPDLPTSMNMFLQYWDEYSALANASVKAVQEGRLMPGNAQRIEELQLLAPVRCLPVAEMAMRFVSMWKLQEETVRWR